MERPPLFLALTAGEPAGIGVDLCLQLAQEVNATPFVVLCDKSLLQQRAKQLGLTVQVHDYQPEQIAPLPAGHIRLLHVPLPVPAEPGVLNPANSPYVLALLTRATQGCLSGEFSAMVTAPVHKGVINDASISTTSPSRPCRRNRSNRRNMQKEQ